VTGTIPAKVSIYLFCVPVNFKIPRHISVVISPVLAKTVKIRCVRCVCKTAAKSTVTFVKSVYLVSLDMDFGDIYIGDFY
jgi:hypothetical protein